MALDKAKIVEELSNATVIEIAELVKDLETKWGVSAAAPVAAAAAAPGPPGAGPRLYSIIGAGLPEACIFMAKAAAISDPFCGKAETQRILTVRICSRWVCNCR